MGRPKKEVVEVKEVEVKEVEVKETRVEIDLSGLATEGRTIERFVGKKEIGGVTLYTCVCSDGCTYDFRLK